MKLPHYSLDLEKITQTIREKNYQIIAVQIPEGLKRNIYKIVEFLEKETQTKVVVIADPCYGACDLVDNRLKNLGVEFVIHIGHTAIPDIHNFSIPTIFLNALSNKDVTKVVEKSINSLEGNKIGIVTTAQHTHTIEKIKDILKRHSFTPIISKGDKKIYAKGQILGCNFSTGINIVEKVDSFLFIGSGMFHPLGLLLSSKKPVVAADPYTNMVKKKELNELKDTILRQRYGAIASSKQARTFGILIGIKQGQQRIKLALNIKKMLNKLNKKSLLIAMDNYSPVSLQGFSSLDCVVSTACPRIAIDDYLQYKIPILTPIELEIVLGRRKWEDYIFDQILG